MSPMQKSKLEVGLKFWGVSHREGRGSPLPMSPMQKSKLEVGLKFWVVSHREVKGSPLPMSPNIKVGHNKTKLKDSTNKLE